MKKAIFITVRTGSSRLPSKPLLKIRDKHTIEYVINNVKKSSLADQIILCTTDKQQDLRLCEIAEENEIQYFRGEEENKWNRWMGACEKFGIDFFVNADGDDLFYESDLADICFQQVLNSDNKEIVIDGQGLYNDVYGISSKTLSYIRSMDGIQDIEPHHLIKFLKNSPIEVKKIQNVPKLYEKRDSRMTLDYPEDFSFFKTVIEHFGDKEYDLGLINKFLDENPSVKHINYFLEKKWKENQQGKSMKNPTKYKGNEIEYLKKVLSSETLSSTEGSWTGNLEKSFAQKFGAKHGIAFNSGTSTLHAALEAVGVKAGDEVISPAFTVIMNTTSTLHANAVPVYADVLEDKFTIDPEDIRRKITPKTKAICVVSIYGLPCEMDEIMSISKEFGIPVIEDNAECFLSKYKGKMTGVIGDMASYSFENSKHLSCGEGGILITNNTEYARMSRKVGGHGFKNLEADEGRVKLDLDVFQNPNYKRHDTLGWNYRLSEICSAVALAQLERLDEFVSLRVESANLFLEAIEGCDFLIPQVTPDYSENSYWSLGLKYTGEDKIGLSWYEFRKKYMMNGGDGIYGAWSVPYLEPLISSRKYVSRLPQIYENTNYYKGMCPVAERIQSQMMVFKTNYRDLSLAKMKAECLRKTILEVS